jgi:AraC-like DNA-binding protein
VLLGPAAFTTLVHLVFLDYRSIGDASVSRWQGTWSIWKNDEVHGKTMIIADIARMERVGFFQAVAGVHYAVRPIPANRHELEIILDGAGIFEWEGRSFRAEPGSTLWFCPGDPIVVTADSARPYETCVLRFDMARLPDERPPFYFEWTSLRACKEFCRSLLHRYRLGEAMPLSLAECVYARLHWEAVEFGRRQMHAPAPAVERAFTFIEEHFAEAVTVSEVAAYAGVSAPHLHALFRRHAGVSPKQAILALRLDKARGLLARSALSVKEISHQSGFGDPSGFCAYFRSKVGVTPGRYRRQQVLTRSMVHTQNRSPEHAHRG